MKIIDRIQQYFFRRWQVLATYSFGWGGMTCHPFGQALFRNVVELLTDLSNDVVWKNAKLGQNSKFAEFQIFFERDAQLVLWRYYKQGYVVIGMKDDPLNPKFVVFDEDQYRLVTINNVCYVESKVEGWKCYVMRSELYRETRRSDYDEVEPFVKFLDNVFNSANTASEKMGTFIVASPETPTGYNTPVVLNKEQKKDLENEIAKEYGSLSRQRQMMLLPRGMKFQTLSLEGIDKKLSEKVRLCVLAICDRIKVPANQVAIIDANSSKTLANGSELREGDFNKYQSFERLLNHTFVRMAMEIGLNVTYTIYNKPLRTKDNETNVQ